MSPRDTYVNPLLTNVYIGYGGDQNFVSEQIFKPLNVQRETGVYFVRDKENLRAPADARRGMYGRANRVNNTLTTAPYTLEEKTLEHWIPERIMKQYQDPFDPKKNGITLITDKLKLDQEIDARDTLAGGAGTSIDTSASWATAGTDIVGQVRTGRTAIQKATGKKANTVLLSKDSYDAIMKNTAFLDAVKYTNFPSESALRSKLAEWFDVDQVIVADAINNTAKEGQTDSLDYIWTDVAYVMYVNPNPVIEDTSAGYKLVLENFAYADEWYQQAEKCDVVRVTDFYDNKIVDAGAIYRIYNTI